MGSRPRGHPWGIHAAVKLLPSGWSGLGPRTFPANQCRDASGSTGGHEFGVRTEIAVVPPHKCRYLPFAIRSSHFGFQTPRSFIYFARPGCIGTKLTADSTPRRWRPRISLRTCSKVASILTSSPEFFSMMVNILYTSSSGTSKPTWNP